MHPLAPRLNATQAAPPCAVVAIVTITIAVVVVVAVAIDVGVAIVSHRETHSGTTPGATPLSLHRANSGGGPTAPALANPWLASSGKIVLHSCPR